MPDNRGTAADARFTVHTGCGELKPYAIGGGERKTCVHRHRREIQTPTVNAADAADRQARWEAGRAERKRAKLARNRRERRKRRKARRDTRGA